MCEREKEGERVRERKIDRERGGDVYVKMCVREKERVERDERGSEREIDREGERCM